MLPDINHETNDASPDNQTQDIQHTNKVLKKIIKRKFDTVSERLQKKSGLCYKGLNIWFQA